MKRRVWTATALLAIGLGPAARAGDHWPQFRGPSGDGHSDATGVPREWSETRHVRWKTAIHGRAWSSPVLWGSQVWLTTATKDGKELFAVCVDRDSGKILRDLKVFDVAQPQEIHTFNSYASPTPVIEEGRVYVHFGSAGTACLDTAAGQVLWTRRDLPCNHYRGPGSSPILFRDLLVVHFDGYDVQYVVALDRKTGKTVWKTDRSNDFGGTEDGDFKKAFSTPLVIEAAGRLQLISPGSRAAMAYDPLTGRELWQVRFRSFSSTARPLFGHGLVYINTGFGKADLIAVRPDGKGDVTDTHVAWTAREGIGSKPSPLLVDDLIYVVADNGGVATCLEAKTGKTVWKARIGRAGHSASPVFVDGAVYFFAQDGLTVVVRPGREYAELAKNQLESGFMASPAIVGKAFYLRTETHLYRIEKGAE